VSLFRNGNFLTPAKSIPTTNLVANSPTIWFGSYDGTAYPLIGGIDDVRLYNRALSMLEVRQLFLSEQNCIPHAATATAKVVNGFVVEIDVADTGCSYTNAPVVSIQGGGGTGAAASPVMSYGGVIGFTITNPGSGYTNPPVVLIASPPFTPWLGIAVSKVKVTIHVVLGLNYVVQSSFDLTNWTQVGTQFTAEAELIEQEFDGDVTGRYFRILQVP